MKLWYRLVRLLVAAILLGVLGLGMIASLPNRPSLAALPPGGLLYAWGYNVSGQLGDGTTIQRNTPQLITLPNGATPTAIAAGTSHSLAIGSNGKLYAWGGNTYGQLGDSTNTNHATPVPISLPNGATPATIAASGDHSLAISTNGKLYAWGDNTSGQLGDGTNSNRNTPVPVSLPNGVTPIAIAAGAEHSLAIGNDGKLYVWGSAGRMGDGTNNQRNSPGLTNLPGGAIPTFVAAGYGHSLVSANNGKLYTWGDNQYGQLGNGDYSPGVNTPQQISLSNGITPTALAGGYIHSVAVGSDGKLYSTGDNRSGQLGNGTTYSRLTMGSSSLPNGATLTTVAAGWYSNLAIGTDGKLYAWGDNYYGQLGDGTLIERDTPVKINLPAGVKAIAIAAGAEHSLAIAAPPNLSIDDVSLVEGNSGTTAFNFTISLSSPSPVPVTFDIATQDDTATAASGDYTARSLTAQTIPIGSTNYTFTVQVNGDTTLEPDETFKVLVTNTTGAIPTKTTGIGTILSDDTCDPLLVTSNGDDGKCGTLRQAVLYAAHPPLSSKPKTIRIALPAGTTISLTTGLTLNSGAAITTTAQCGVGTGNTMLPPIIIQGVGASSGNGLTLSGNNDLYGLWVRGFSGVQIKAPPGSSTHMQCVRVSKL